MPEAKQRPKQVKEEAVNNANPKRVKYENSTVPA